MIVLKTLLLSVFISSFFAISTSAQSSLQPTNSGLQPQSPAQNTGGVQNNVSTSTETNDQSSTVLSTPKTTPLGVVGSPSKANPDVKVGTSTTTTSVASEPAINSTNKSLLITAGATVLALTIFGLYYFRNTNKENYPPTHDSDETTKKSTSKKPSVKTETASTPKQKKKKKPTKKSKKRY